MTVDETESKEGDMIFLGSYGEPYTGEYKMVEFFNFSSFIILSSPSWLTKIQIKKLKRQVKSIIGYYTVLIIILAKYTPMWYMATLGESNTWWPVAQDGWVLNSRNRTAAQGEA